MNNFFFCVIMVAIMISSVTVQAQTTARKILSEKDYDLWHDIYPGAISPSGKWVAYYVNYPAGPDSVWVCSAENGSATGFEKIRNISFSPDSRWFAGQDDSGVICVSLANLQQIRLPHASKAQWAATGELLFQDSSGFHIRDLVNNKSRDFGTGIQYQLNGDKSAVVFSTKEAQKNAIYLLPLTKRQTPILLDSGTAASFENLAWQRKGQNLAFVKKTSLKGSATSQYHLVFVDRSGRSLKIFNQSYEQLIDSVTEPQQSPLIISDDGKSVFFSRHSKTRLQAVDSIVQVWHGMDQWLYPQREGLPVGANSSLVTGWWPERNLVRKIGTPEKPSVVFLGDQRKVIRFSPIKSYPQFKQTDDVDLYLLDLLTGEEVPFIENFENGTETQLVVSPGGRYVAYYHLKSWNLYDTKTAIHRPLTSANGNFEYPFAASNSDGSIYSYGYVGWTSNDESFIVYDEYDCWRLRVDGSQPERLTNGASTKTRYRVERNPDREPWTSDFGGKVIDLTKGLIMEALQPDKTFAYYRWKTSTGLQKIADSKGKATSILTTNDLNYAVLLDQSFDRPPALLWANNKGETRNLRRSNPQHYQYEWGKSVLHKFINGKGNEAYGVITFPGGYQPGKKYPMIVEIYQNKSSMLHEYERPTMEMGAGLNASVYTTQGYIILRPDISYVPGDAGMSAVRDVEAAVKSVIALGIVDQKRIGLTGHSFGGFETAFIVTQSKLFAAAIAGAPITDLVKNYFTINEEYRKTSDMWRFEHQQQRFGFTLWQKPENYLRNSPVMHADKIQTPLLLWTGMEDRNVHWHQSIEMYLALRRLGKPCMLLVYPGEHHVIMQENRQRDMTRRTREWFDHYLKSAPATEWMKTPGSVGMDLQGQQTNRAN